MFIIENIRYRKANIVDLNEIATKLSHLRNPEKLVLIKFSTLEKYIEEEYKKYFSSNVFVPEDLEKFEI